MQQRFLKRSFFQRFGFVFGLVSLLALVPTESHSQDDAAEPVADYHAMVKITDWNPDQNIGIAKIKKDVVVFKIDDAKTQIRVDQVLRCGQVNELDQLKSRTIWTFAKLDKYLPGYIRKIAAARRNCRDYKTCDLFALLDVSRIRLRCSSTS